MASERTTERFFEPSDLTEYTLRQRWLIRSAAFVFYVLVRLVGKTVRFSGEGLDRLVALQAAGHAPILSLWHNRTFLGMYGLRGRKIVVLTSRSFDGEYIARMIQRFGFGAVRGSSSRGGVGSLVEMARLGRQNVTTAVTPDGPRGPRYVMKTGPVFLAKKTGQPILPLNISPTHYWAMRSWDGYRIPKPFTRAVVTTGEPIWVSRSASDDEIEEKRLDLQQAMDDLYN